MQNKLQIWVTKSTWRLLRPLWCDMFKRDEKDRWKNDFKNWLSKGQREPKQFFCVSFMFPQNKKSYKFGTTKELMTDFRFWVNCPFKSKLPLIGGLKWLTASSFSSRSLLSWFFSSLLAFRISRSCSLSSETEARLLCISSRSVFSRSLLLFSDSRCSLSTQAAWSCSRTRVSWESWEDSGDIKTSQYDNNTIWSPWYNIHCKIYIYI